MTTGCNGRVRVLILGGGIGGLTAAFELTRTEAARKKYHVTLMQHGWRLGGKAASGRAGVEGRVEEHGLHLLMGFYDHAFQVMRACYGELRADPWERFQHWDDAFKPQYTVHLGAAGSLEGINPITLPKLPGTPGDPRLALNPLDLVAAWTTAQGSLFSLLIAVGVPTPIAQAFNDFAAAVLAALGTFGSGVPALVQSALATLQFFVNAVLAVTPLPEWIERLIRIALAFTRGVVSNTVILGDFESINHLDFRQWLRDNGAIEADLWGGLVTGLYDLAFAYKDGDRNQPLVEAGTMAKTFIRMAATYRDAPLWRMESGMGDVVVAPLFRVLEGRDVDVRLFHRVVDVKLDASATRVASVTVSRQVHVAPDAPGGRYEPLKRYGDMLGWPSAPLWDQIKDGHTLSALDIDLESQECLQEVERFTLNVDDHFDVVVMALTPGAFTSVCPDLVNRVPDWSAMATNLKTVRTQVMQLWFDRTADLLGPLPNLSLLSGNTPAFDSWGEMSHVLPAEDWSASATPPQSVGYLCGVMSETAVGAAAAKLAVRTEAGKWLDEPGIKLWPLAVSAGVFDTSVLVKPSGATAPNPLDAQFFRANIDPTERYVLSLPGSSTSRRAPGNSGVSNLFLAGDWVKTSINGGASESAFEGGVEAGRAMLARYGT